MWMFPRGDLDNASVGHVRQEPTLAKTGQTLNLNKLNVNYVLQA
jgi:hypothetical protein